MFYSTGMKEGALHSQSSSCVGYIFICIWGIKVKTLEGITLDGTELESCGLVGMSGICGAMNKCICVSG